MDDQYKKIFLIYVLFLCEKKSLSVNKINIYCIFWNLIQIAITIFNYSTGKYYFKLKEYSNIALIFQYLYWNIMKHKTASAKNDVKYNNNSVHTQVKYDKISILRINMYVPIWKEVNK